MNFVFIFIASVFSTFSIAYLFYKLTNTKKFINYKIVIIFIVGVLMEALIQYNNSNFLSAISYFIYFPILFSFINPMPLRKHLFYVFVVWFYGIVIDILSLLIVPVVSYVFKFNFYSNPELVSFSLTLFVSTVLIIFGKFGVFNNRVLSIYKKIQYIKYSDLSLIIFACFTLGIAIVMLFNINSININFLLVLVVVLTIMMFVLLIRYKISEEENVKYLKTLKENNEFYMKIDDENRIFKHNLIAKLLSIKSVSNKKAMLLIDDLIVQFNKNINFSKDIKIIPYGLNGIIYQKLYSFLEELNVKIINNINYDIFTVLKPRRYNVFVEKMVVVLDNAIESCLKSNSKVIVINIYDDEDNICMEVENTFTDNINLDLLGSIDYSTKGKKRGLGLFSIFRNNEAIVSVKIVNDVFVSKITTKKRLSN